MRQTSWSGIFPSLPTPFTGDGDLDLASLRAVVRFAIDSGADGLVCFGLAGEVFRLTPGERMELLRCIVDEVGGRVPVVAGVGAEATHTSLELARQAAALGADGVVVPPPLTAPPSREELLEYFTAIAASVDLPVMVQDAPEYLNVEVGPELVAELAERAENLAAVKLEVAANGLEPWKQTFDGELRLFCGNGGLHLIDCVRHGAGEVSGTDLVDVLVEVYRLWVDDDEPQALAKLRDVLPMLVFQMQTIEHYNATAKYVLQQRGILQHDAMRKPAPRLNATARAVLDRYLAELRVPTA